MNDLLGGLACVFPGFFPGFLRSVRNNPCLDRLETRIDLKWCVCVCVMCVQCKQWMDDLH